MNQNLKRLAVIPAKSTSKRVPNKNIRKFLGKPIIEYTIQNALKSKLFNKIHISTDSKKIKKLVEKNKKIKIDFMRPKYLSHDKISLFKVMNYVKKEYKKKKINFEEIWLLYACSPLTTHLDLIKASKIFNKTNKIFPLISLKEYDAPIEWSLKKKSDGIFKPDNINSLKIDSKNTKKRYYESASFIILKSNKLHNNNSYKKFYGYKMPKYRSVDIDDFDDWKLAEILFKFKK